MERCDGIMERCDDTMVQWSDAMIRWYHRAIASSFHDGSNSVSNVYGLLPSGYPHKPSIIAYMLNAIIVFLILALFVKMIAPLLTIKSLAKFTLIGNDTFLHLQREQLSHFYDPI